MLKGDIKTELLNSFIALIGAVMTASIPSAIKSCEILTVLMSVFLFDGEGEWRGIPCSSKLRAKHRFTSHIVEMVQINFPLLLESRA
jgi:hypothetical protein